MNQPPGPPGTIRYGIDVTEGLALVQFSGVVTGVDMLRAVERLHHDPEWRDGTSVIWDCSDVLAHVIAPEEVDPVVEEEVRGGQGQDVLVESHMPNEDYIAQLLSRMVSRRGKPLAVRWTLPEALAALGRENLPASLRRLEGSVEVDASA